MFKDLFGMAGQVAAVTGAASGIATFVVLRFVPATAATPS